jgi:hypothetical protein
MSGFYHRWNSVFERRHPSLWLFIRRLKDEQKLSEIAIAAARDGQPPAPRRRKWRNFEQRVQRLKQDYNTGTRTVNQYWKAMAASMKRAYL